MTSLARQLARPDILALPCRNAIAGSPEDYSSDAVRLHLNESPNAPLATSKECLAANRYPEPSVPALRSSLARLYGVTPQDLIATRGADDAIDILIRTFCRSGVDRIATFTPTFGAYALFARIQGAGVVECPLGPGFAFEARAYVDAVTRTGSVKLAFLCSPNNPTGNVIAPDEVLKVADALGDCIVVLDEAYIEFADIESLAAEATRRDNLVVLRTLSKAYGLAGARVGCAIANPELIDLLGRALPPFPLAAPSVSLALATLDPTRRLLVERRIAESKAERKRLAEQLPKSPLVARTWPSQTNFILLEVTDPALIASELERRGVRVRWRPEIGPNVLRLSVGAAQENDLALAAFGLKEDRSQSRRAELVRETKETRIALRVDLDRAEPRRIETGLPFFDHMLDQVAAHGGFSLILNCEGDLKVDPHHCTEDVAVALGTALSQALGERRGIGRYGFALPMDEAKAQVLIDLSGRPYSRFTGSFAASHIGAWPTEMTGHVFRSIADGLRAAIHVAVEGENDHHKTESCFKAFGRALRQAMASDAAEWIPSTKGAL
jgi:histidinol-phosphate aminotransferase/imidazoleglycerol-phosphate dehydratase/histidinol-phosphatase